ncbi:cytochrome c [Salinicola sp. CR57]|uniref:c-type cytochrome n=1 Tax=Salinicola sp. CR57 TaxID=1949086 RepID=UPI000DA2146C|nr:cytochrome c [Salinicola sp. CR57]
MSRSWSQVSVGMLAMGLVSVALPAVAQEHGSSDDAQIERGAYLARAGDCVACHTAPGGTPFAGGLAIDSPFGTIYSTNITPDKDHGIGNYSRDQFAAAVRQGVRADGANLYPAMPYPAYAKVSDEDIDALYAYFMHGVEPVSEQPTKTDLSFPFNQRWGVGLWDWFFTDDPTTATAPGGENPVARGRYLVEGLGHCGSCHTPRGLAYQSKALDDSDSDFLSGANLNGWLAPALRGGDGVAGMGISGWSEGDIVEYLATGRNAHAAVGGEMTSVIEHSTSHLSDDDLQAIAAYLKTLPSVDSDTQHAFDATTDSDTEQQLTGATDISEGAELYLNSCNACHFANGKGAPRVFPSLVGNSLINADDPAGLIHIILAGAELPSTPKAPERLMMPGFAWRMSDKEIANLATFLRQGWGNQAPGVSADQVAAVRSELDPEETHSSQPDPVYAEPNASEQE